MESLTGFSELVSGVGEWIAPSPELIQQSAQDIHRSLSAATWLNQQFGEDVSAQLFAEWVQLSPLHTLEELADVPVDCEQWKTLARQAYKEYISSMRQALSKPQTQEDFEPDSPHGVDPILTETANLAHKLFLTGIKQGKKLAQDLMVEALCSVCDANHFLPLLDQFLGHGILPSNIKPVVQAAISLGINPDEVYDRIGNAVEQLRQMILNNLREVSRYQHLIKKINHIGSDVMVELVLQCLDETNFEGMAALLAIDMGEAVTLLMSSANDSGSAEGFISNSIAYKGIGGGSNLLKQWFNSRGKLNSALKAQIKVIAKDALIDVALEWINKGSGSSEGGLIPQNQARPYLSGDDLDLLDIENTLDAIINSGKSLDAITEEDLYVHDTSKGRAAFGVLLDISGSMSGDDLAMCAIAIVMLLGKVKSEEIALAVFESDTHVIKPFSDARDLDHVADQVLDIEATGGTCVDAALRWVSDEFEGVPEADFKILFLLTDFGFFEERKEISPLLDELSANGVDYLGAAHGYITKEYNELFLEKLGGQSIKIKNMKELPGVLIEALEQIKDSA